MLGPAANPVKEPIVTNPQAAADTREMYMVHTMFRREFAALPALVRSVPALDTERACLIAEHIDLLTAVLDAHHRSEDTHLWPKLLERGGSDDVLMVNVMEGHHESIEQLTTQTATAQGEWQEDASAERGEILAGVLDRLYRLLYDHMRLEEQRILPLAEKYVTAEEWHAMSGASGA